ncbi:MAG: hypothetical protein IJ660_01565 [Alphaproteobacteria bacterium]|nr:hypothetical protein [Alphaproteobacteria bacterium]
MTDLFDLTNVDDLPEDVRKDINVDLFAKRIIDLFELAQRDLSIDEITVAYYRKYSAEDTDIKLKKQIMSKVYNMSRERNPKIKSVEGQKGVYSLCSGYDEGKDYDKESNS